MSEIADRIKNKMGLKDQQPATTASQVQSKASKIKAACGHEVDYPHVPNDKFPEERLKKFTDRPCKACRVAAHDEQVRKSEAANTVPAPKPKKKQKDWSKYQNKGRLPHGATFHAVYDAEKQRWNGTLTIPLNKNIIVSQVFNGEKGSVFTLMSFLDQQYREWLAAKEKIAIAENPADKVQATQ